MIFSIPKGAWARGRLSTAFPETIGIPNVPTGISLATAPVHLGFDLGNS
jgi:hypothetical protein